MAGSGTIYKLRLILFLGLAGSAWGQPAAAPFDGSWELLPDKSSAVSLYGRLALKTARSGDRVTIVQTWGAGGEYPLTHRWDLRADGRENSVPVTNRVWPENLYVGVSMDQSQPEQAAARWSADGRRLDLDRTDVLLASQGRTILSHRDTYELSPYGDELTLTLTNPNRPGPPARYVFKRAGSKQAWVMHLGDHWEVAGDLEENALLISLQGLANGSAPQLYFVYPADYDYRDTGQIFDYYRQHLDYTFTELRSIPEALRTFRPAVKGYVVWDPAARVSLDVAFTAAGLEKCIVVSPAQIPLAQALDLKPIADFRGQFEGWSDAAVFRWAYQRYGARCSRDTIVWMGGEAGPRMLPGIADYGISQGAFFADLGTDPARTPAEYALAREILGRQHRLSMVMGWHSYVKDRERNYVALASSFADRIEGLNTHPNLSFTSRTPPSPGFKFTNHRHVVAGRVYRPEKKIYLACIQSDGLGLGAWNRPGRGEIPYAWEVTINWLWMCPAVLEYYYASATPNDYFIGALAGPGYMHPRAIPPALLPQAIRMADDMIRQLDIEVFETLDYSRGDTTVGTTLLPKSVVDAYYQGMPEVIGFANGYTADFTFASRGGRPFVSYDYYLAEDRSDSDCVHDLEELGRINRVRPYFLLVHVREWNDIARVKAILDRLGPEFVVEPLDVFLKLAGEEPTFQERYLAP